MDSADELSTHGVPAFLMRLHDFVHVRIEPEATRSTNSRSTQLVEVGERLATQISRGPDDEVLELQATESYRSAASNTPSSSPIPACRRRIRSPT